MPAAVQAEIRQGWADCIIATSWPPELMLQTVLVRIVAFGCLDGYKIDCSDENVPDPNRWIY